MTIKRDKGNYDLWGLIDFMIEEAKLSMFTAMPGIVEEYDPDTRRARVRGSIHQSFWNLETHTIEDRERSVIPNVPVVQPSGGGYCMHIPLEKGDPVLLVFSCRPITEWKKEMEPGPAKPSSIMMEMDAMAIPGFCKPGTAGSTGSSGKGVTLQSHDGKTFLNLSDEGVSVAIAAPEDADDEDNHPVFHMSKDEIRMEMPYDEDDPDQDEDNKPSIVMKDGNITIKSTKGEISVESENQSSSWT